MTRPQRPLGLALALVVALALPGSAAAQGTAEGAPAKPAVPTVTVVQAAQAEMVGRVPVSGTLVPRQEVLVYPQVNGFTIDTLAVDVGDLVAKGDVLAQLNSRTLDAQRAQAAAELARAQAAISQARSQIDSTEASATQAGQTLRRTQTLRDNGTVTQAQLDEAIAASQTADAAAASARDGLAVAEAQAQQARAQLDIAELNLDHATLRSPVDGVISSRNGQIGAIAASGGEPIFRIIQDGEVEVEAEVIETALGDIVAGDRAELDIAGIGRAAGEVRRVSPTVDATTRLGTIRVTVDEAAGLRSGLFASGWIITDERTSLAVPSSAVLTDMEGTYVLAVEDDRLRKMEVRTGLIWDGRREILEGLSEGDMVVAKAGAFYGDGDAVRPVERDAPPAAGAQAQAQAATPEQDTLE
jgi:HlyD family secretion protein